MLIISTGRKNWVTEAKVIFDEFVFSEVFINPTFNIKELCLFIRNAY